MASVSPATCRPLSVGVPAENGLSPSVRLAANSVRSPLVTVRSE